MYDRHGIRPSRRPDMILRAVGVEPWSRVEDGTGCLFALVFSLYMGPLGHGTAGIGCVHRACSLAIGDQPPGEMSPQG